MQITRYLMFWIGFLIVFVMIFSSKSRWGCQITDNGLFQLSTAKCIANLTCISLWGMTGITDKGVAQLVCVLSKTFRIFKNHAFSLHNGPLIFNIIILDYLIVFGFWLLENKQVDLFLLTMYRFQGPIHCNT